MEAYGGGGEGSISTEHAYSIAWASGKYMSGVPACNRYLMHRHMGCCGLRCMTATCVERFEKEKGSI